MQSIMNKLSDFYANRDTINGWYIDKQDCLRVKDYAEAGVPQGKALPGTATASRSATYVNGLSTGLPISQNVYGIKTGHDMFEVAVSRFPKQNCLGHREYDAATKRWSKYVWQTYETVSRRRNNVAAGLMHLYSEFTKVRASPGVRLTRCRSQIMMFALESWPRTGQNG